MTTLEKLEELIYKGFQETDRKFQETDHKFQETDRKFQETDRKFQETDQFQRETGKQMRETDKKLKAWGQEVFGLTKSMGLFAEHSVKPAVPRLFANRGIEITELYSRASVRRNGSAMEMDVLGAGAQHVIAVEVKLRLEQDDIKDFLEKLPRFFDFFTQYRGRTLYGAVAGMSIDESVDRFAYKNGLFVLGQSGENICFRNDEKFVPRAYSHPA
jgi:hypothetical protein